MIDPKTDMRLTILGSGTCVPSLERSACAALVQTGGANLLFDVGPGTMHRLLAAGVTVFDISHLFLSHFHPDHTGELASFLFSNKYPEGRRRKQPLALFGGNGFGQFMERLVSVYGNWIQLAPGMVETVELNNTAIASRPLGDLTVTWGPVSHNPESTAYRISGPGGRSIVVSGDTDYCESLITLAKEADILVCESAFPDELKTPGHLTPSGAAEIAARADVGRLVLTHLYPECDAVDIEAQCRKGWRGPLSIAQDLMTIDLDP